jgi:hypothetical protein
VDSFGAARGKSSEAAHKVTGTTKKIAASPVVIGPLACIAVQMELSI